MNREKLRHFGFVGTVCLLSFPWLTPCVGIWSSAAINSTHDSITKRNDPLSRLPDPRLKEWATRPGPKLTILENQSISKSSLVTDGELSFPNGGRNAPRPGTLVGKGASALVDGVSQTLNWVDPFTFATGNSLGVRPTKPKRRLILCESPFVMLEGDEIRYVRDAKSGRVKLVKTGLAKATIITPEGSCIARAERIHYRSGTQVLVLEGGCSVMSGSHSVYSARPAVASTAPSLTTLDFVKRRVLSETSFKSDPPFLKLRAPLPDLRP